MSSIDVFEVWGADDPANQPEPERRTTVPRWRYLVPLLFALAALLVIAAAWMNLAVLTYFQAPNPPGSTGASSPAQQVHVDGWGHLREHFYGTDEPDFLGKSSVFAILLITAGVFALVAAALTGRAARRPEPASAVDQTWTPAAALLAAALILGSAVAMTLDIIAKAHPVLSDGASTRISVGPCLWLTGGAALLALTGSVAPVWLALRPGGAQ